MALVMKGILTGRRNGNNVFFWVLLAALAACVFLYVREKRSTALTETAAKDEPEAVFERLREEKERLQHEIERLQAEQDMYLQELRELDAEPEESGTERDENRNGQNCTAQKSDSIKKTGK